MEKKTNYKENQQFLFNIIIPVFNAEKYLAKCLSSVIKQSYKNFQVKVVDDCSTDSSYEVASAICANYKNFDIYRNTRRLGALKNILKNRINLIKKKKSLDPIYVKKLYNFILILIMNLGK